MCILAYSLSPSFAWAVYHSLSPFTTSCIILCVHMSVIQIISTAGLPNGGTEKKKKRSCLLTLNLSISLISDITHQEEILDLITQQLKRPHELLTNA